MPVRIAVPENPVYKRLYANSEEISKKYDARVLPVTEAQCAELLKTKRVDATLISAISYGKSVLNADLRVISGPMLATTGYSGLASIYFNKGLSFIDSCAAQTPEEFLMVIGKLMLSERYNINLDLKAKKGNIEELLAGHDSAMAWQSGFNDSSAMDICELWSDSFNLPLPIVFWACHAEEHPENINEIVKALADNNLPKEEAIKEDYQDKDTFAREGTFHWQWNDDMEYALDQAIHMLFYRQLLPEIAAVKILGRD